MIEHSSDLSSVSNFASPVTPKTGVGTYGYFASSARGRLDGMFTTVLDLPDSERLRQEQAAQGLLDAIAQVHRRELRARRLLTQAGLELARVQSASKIGMTLQATGRSFFRWMKTAWELYRSHSGSEICAEPLTATSEGEAPLTFDGGKNVLAIPLTLKPQEVILPPSFSPSALSITFIGRNSDSQSAVEVTFDGRGNQDSLMSVNRSAIMRSAATGGPLVKRVDLAANLAVPLIEIARTIDPVRFSLRRVRGEFGVVRLVYETGAQTMETANALPSEEPGRKNGRYGERRSQLAGLVARDRGTTFSAANLELKLWGGFSQYALAELEALKRNSSEHVGEREAAAWYLTRWYFVEGQYLKALENIHFSKHLQRNVRARVFLAEVQCLMCLGRFEEAHTTLKEAMEKHAALDFALIQSTVIRKVEESRGLGSDEAELLQLEAINGVLTGSGLAPIAKKDDRSPLTLANITSYAEPRIIEQHEKVSVVIPAYNCAATIGWVLDSILRQTWRNLEVIVVDDLSTDDTCSVVDDVVRQDGRVRLVRKAQNDGAYATRNVGASIATGDLVMVHDSDDWSHPERIERQVEELRRHPTAVGVKSYWVRVSMNLDILGAWITRGSVFDLNFSSLLVRRELLETVGLWDNVAVSGDAEFYSRIRSIYGDDAVVKISKRHLLALSLTREDSLTRSKATHLRSLFYGLRWSYRDAYLFWHEKLRRNTPVEKLPFEPARERPFPFPIGMKPGAKQLQPYDLIVVFDFSLGDELLRTTVDYILAARRIGMRTAVFNWPMFELYKRDPLQPLLYETCLAHDVDILCPGDNLDADVLLFTLPAVLQYKLDPIPEIRAKRVILVVAESEGKSATYRGVQYDPALVRSHLRTAFGTDGVWIPSSGAAAKIVQSYSRSAVRKLPWLPLIDSCSWPTGAGRWRAGSRSVPVVGRHVSDPMDWPSDSAVLRRLFGDERRWDVRIMGASDRILSVTGPAPANWSFVEYDSASVRRFLEDLDFYICCPRDRQVSGCERAVIEALASGVPVIASPKLANVFGDAAIYALPKDIGPCVDALWASEEKYLEQVGRGIRFVREACDIAVLAPRLAGIQEPGHAAQAMQSD